MKKKLVAKPSAGNVIAIVSLIICLFTLIISYKAYYAQKAEAAPYFVASNERVVTADNLDYAMSLKNIGGNIRSVNCSYVDYLKTIFHDESTGRVDEKYIKIIIEDSSVQYNYETKSIPVIMNVVQLVGELEYIGPILQFNADESFYCEYVNEKEGGFYTPRHLDYEFVHCIQLDYKDYQHKDKQMIVEIPLDSELDHYEIRERSDLPRVSNDAVFRVGKSTKIDVGSMIFKQHGIQYKVANGYFVFYH